MYNVSEYQPNPHPLQRLLVSFSQLITTAPNSYYRRFNDNYRPNYARKFTAVAPLSVQKPVLANMEVIHSQRSIRRRIQHRITSNYFAATDESWSRIRRSPSIIVSSVCRVSSMVTQREGGTTSDLETGSWICALPHKQQLQLDSWIVNITFAIKLGATFELNCAELNDMTWHTACIATT